MRYPRPFGVGKPIFSFCMIIIASAFEAVVAAERSVAFICQRMSKFECFDVYGIIDKISI